LTDQPPRVLQITESLTGEYGGIAAACASLANHLHGAGMSVTVATVDGGEAGTWLPLDSGVHAVRCTPSWPARLRSSRGLDATLHELAPAVVHVHGLWRLYLRQAARFAQARRAPLVVSTHGMLHAPARRQRAWRKGVVRLLGQDAILQRAACLHATAQEEAAEIRKLGFQAPVAVIPWGVDLPPAATAPGGAPDDRVVLFLGRYHPTKGLVALLRAWARVSGRFPSARLQLAGYDDHGYLAQCRSIAESLGIGGSVAFGGAVAGRDREALFSRSSLVVLPSPSENFGFVVPEALVRGIPVITTQGTPWSSVVTERCGWRVPPVEDALAGALTEALATPASTLRDMGERGRRFARETFVWDRVAASMRSLYAWTLGDGPRPAFVQR
jgi:glycosyltransferase involved in cell wall biosynthesis